MKTTRQGDILLIETPGIDTRGLEPIPREDGDVVLAHGEATGHKHRFRKTTTEFYSLWPQGTAPSARIQHARELLAGLPEISPELNVTGVVKLAEPDALVHEEHGAIAHEPVTHLSIRQCTYEPGRIVVVAD